MATRTTNIQNQPPRNGHGPTLQQQGPAVSRQSTVPEFILAPAAPPLARLQRHPCPVRVSQSVPWSLSTASGSGEVLLLHTSRHHRIATQSETDRKIHRVAAFLLCFPRPAWTSFSSSFSDCSLSLAYCIANLPSPSPLAEQPFNSIPPSALPEASGLLAGCRHARRHIATRANAAHPLVTAEEFKLSRSRLSSSLTLLTSHVVVAQPNRRRRCCRRRQVRLPLLSSVVVPVKWTMHCHCHLATPM